MWNLIIFMIQRSCFSNFWIPIHDGRCGGDFLPTIVVWGVHEGHKCMFGALTGEGLGATPSKLKIDEKMTYKIL